MKSRSEIADNIGWFQNYIATNKNINHTKIIAVLSGFIADLREEEQP